MKKLFFIVMAFCFLAIIHSCGGGGSSSSNPTSDSSATTKDRSIAPPPDTIVKNKPITGNPHPGDEINPVVKTNTKGYAIVYCPSKMITHVPSIINAQISKDQLSAAYLTFIKKIQDQNPNKKITAIEKDIKGDSIDIYENMSVAIEFDADDFKEVSKDNDVTQSFNGKNELEWDWIIKPLHSTEKSIIIFKFYYRDPATNQEMSILEKTISISVQVDTRSYFEKWGDFLLDDPKITLTVIVIPLITFLGGFFTGKRKKK